MKQDLINLCIKCCSDPMKNTRKFGCFAIGNTEFYIQLVELLKDQEALKMIKYQYEKTRSNAAGALGNLVRNLNFIIKGCIRHGALNQLLKLVKFDQTTRISLFSLGNLCQYSECRINSMNYKSEL
ncbi:unnamed protein product [Paramecium octaurelia]|uniref:non-specific serine/threonine protein kinase n=1 Tax=Paramecium octaurelia TaxID=43137 RepID=A0A8S1SJE1_PAROT|nr:unnamed protein product [Paramecium octaurelia]